MLTMTRKYKNASSTINDDLQWFCTAAADNLPITKPAESKAIFIGNKLTINQQNKFAKSD